MCQLNKQTSVSVRPSKYQGIPIHIYFGVEGIGRQQ